MRSTSALASLAFFLAVAMPACGTDTNPANPVPVDPTPQPDAGSVDAGPKAGPVNGTPDTDKITEEYGFFVSPSGRDTNDGTRARPFATFQAGITHAAEVGKIVFACTGTYAEALVVADSISVIGGLDCSDPLHWKPGAAPSRLNAPASPAAIAKSITSPTRLEALDIVAPAASDPGASSIGLLADHSPGLTIAASKITAGDGAKGTNGTDGVALSQAGSVAGAAYTAPVLCHPRTGGIGGLAGNCGYMELTAQYSALPGGKGGVSQCTGAAGKNGGAGGVGGTGGVWKTAFDAGTIKWTVFNAATFGQGPGGPGSGAAGANGGDGLPASTIGTLSADGYASPAGNPGGDGAPGSGGKGGTGGDAVSLGNPGSMTDVAYSGAGGPGGGGGGCPGLAGSPGTGGGASIGVALLASPIVLDGTIVTSATGGAAGLGTIGSDPTPGGAAGDPGSFTLAALPGGNGGTPGVSTNGGNGPSIAIWHSGGVPSLTNNAKAVPGAGAPAIAAVAHTDPTTGATRTIPATAAGVTADIQPSGN